MLCITISVFFSRLHFFAQRSPWVGVTQASWHKQNCSSAAFTSSEALLLMLGRRMRDTREFVSLFQHEQKVISTSLSHG